MAKSNQSSSNLSADMELKVVTTQTVRADKSLFRTRKGHLVDRTTRKFPIRVATITQEELRKRLEAAKEILANGVPEAPVAKTPVVTAPVAKKPIKVVERKKPVVTKKVKKTYKKKVK
ncbi:MAG: hypothetical protein PF440_00250 [Thiomicrorhabdus sp.]|jgi:hypothetical protein|nr:hypothetical protein [Thiomicrorhabdus sp.]